MTKLKDLSELAKIKLEEGEEIVIDGVEKVTVVVVPDEPKVQRKAKRR